MHNKGKLNIGEEQLKKQNKKQKPKKKKRNKTGRSTNQHNIVQLVYIKQYFGTK